jgi:hypothetical protein
MNSWRDGRDELGWKLSNKAFNLFMTQCRRNAEDGRDPLSSQPSDQDAPIQVQAVPLVKEHLLVLCDMFKSLKPVLRLVRGKNGTIQVGYVFGDASGEEGFGASWTRAVLDEIGYRFGIWGAFGEDTSSNLREFHNLVDSVERERPEISEARRFSYSPTTQWLKLLPTKALPRRQLSSTWWFACTKFR